MGAVLVWRVIEILKFFQDSSSISIDFLTDKFNVTSRTLQRDIVFINSSLKRIRNCKIFRKQNDFLFNDVKKQKAIKTLLAQFIQTANENTFVRISVLFLSLVWQKNYVTSSELLANITSANMYILKKDIISLNNFLDTHNLNIKLEFKTNLGFKLIGCEQNLLFITTIMTINSNKEFSSSLNEKSLAYIYQTIKTLIINSGYKKYYNEQLIWFLTIAIRRMKFNYFLTKNMLIKFDVPKIIKKDIDNLLTLIVKQFDIKLDTFAEYYLNLVFLINVRTDNGLFPEVMLKINKITDEIFLFITNNYQIRLYSNIFKQVLKDYLTDNWFKLVFNYNSNISFYLVDSCDIESKYQWGQQLILIINSQLKKLQFFPNINILELQYLAMAFNKSFISTL
ncbi:HTH domain-containing protein [Spiroplasma sp. AdecLV25b]|uniref:HTH domain-containing protein n=1 Tax=Spiroplasma sp. AdecLV25b TaxID=3027162 RepID=UPI0027E0989B|nr:HTH domain-containing protein [Spiroplasma sp. AdecLV25b]